MLPKVVKHSLCCLFPALIDSGTFIALGDWQRFKRGGSLRLLAFLEIFRDIGVVLAKLEPLLITEGLVGTISQYAELELPGELSLVHFHLWFLLYNDSRGCRCWLLRFVALSLIMLRMSIVLLKKLKDRSSVKAFRMTIETGALLILNTDIYATLK